MRTILVVGLAVLAAGAVAFGVAAAPKVDTKVINDFEADDDKAMFADSKADISISTEHATSGKQSLKVAWSGFNPLSAIATLPADWTGCKSFKFDVFMDADANFTLRLKDKAGKEYTEWQHPLSAGANTVTIDLAAAGDKLDVKQIFHFFMYLVDENGKATGYVDNFRLEK